MKKYCLFFLTFVLIIIACEKENTGLYTEEIVNIPDTSFLNALINEGFDTNSDGLISYAEADTVTVLLVGYSDIIDMTGIEAFINLEHLWCGFNSFTDLELSNNPNLKYLSCHDRPGMCLPVSGGSLRNLDISNNPLLETLDISYNQFTTLSLCNNERIRYLNIVGNNKLDTVYVWATPFPPTGIEVEGLDNDVILIDCG